VGPRAGLDRCGKSPPTGIRSLDRPTLSESLYRLSYTGPHLSRVGEGRFYKAVWHFSVGISEVINMAFYRLLHNLALYVVIRLSEQAAASIFRMS